MKLNIALLILVLLTRILPNHGQIIPDSITTIKSIIEYKIAFIDSLSINDTTLTKESKFDSLGELTAQNIYENKQLIYSSYKRSNGTWGCFGILTTDTPCEAEIITKKTIKSKLVEEEYWGDCICGKVYFKKVYIYDEKTDDLRKVLKYNSDGKLTEANLFIYEYYYNFVNRH